MVPPSIIRGGRGERGLHGIALGTTELGKATNQPVAPRSWSREKEPGLESLS